MAAVLSSLLLVLSFPQIALGPLAWISLVPLLLLCLNTSPLRAFLFGWITGTLAFIGIIYWLVIAIHRYGDTPLPLSWLVLALLTAYLGLYVGLFAGFITRVLQRSPRPFVLMLIAPPAWVSLELLRTYLFSGFPWALLGYSQFEWLPIIQIADMTGVYGVSFLIVLVNTFLSLLIQTLRARWRDGRHVRIAPLAFPAVATIVCMSLALLYGQSRQETVRTASDHRTLRLGLVQANIDQDKKWDPAFLQDTMSRYHDLTTQAVRDAHDDPVDMIVWPEAATPFIFASQASLRDRITALVQRQQTPLLFGSVAVKDVTDGPAQLLNRAYLLSPQGTVLNQYDKIHLVPFGEYVPDAFPFVTKIGHGIGDYVPGTEYTIMSGPHGRFGVAICFDVIYPNLVRHFVKHGAEYMVTITNDAWYDRSSAPYQHFSMVVFRAVENRVSFARAANTGISGFINADGSITHTTDLFEQTVTVGAVTLGHDQSAYTIFGDIFAYTCVVVTVALRLGRLLLVTVGRLRRRYGTR